MFDSMMLREIEKSLSDSSPRDGEVQALGRYTVTNVALAASSSSSCEPVSGSMKVAGCGGRTRTTRESCAAKHLGRYREDWRPVF